LGKKTKGEVILNAKTDIDVVGNIMIGGVIGVVSDFASGTAYGYKPKVQMLLDCKDE
tara:strand:+ start:879 stop:1049 length:171 start_codon:yes stop_codon:yes gene_type:complete